MFMSVRAASKRTRVLSGCRIQSGRSLQSFEAAHSLVHTVIEQEDSFV
jgi:hypothetical protein